MTTMSGSIISHARVVVQVDVMRLPATGKEACRRNDGICPASPAAGESFDDGLPLPVCGKRIRVRGGAKLDRKTQSSVKRRPRAAAGQLEHAAALLLGLPASHTATAHASPLIPPLRGHLPPPAGEKAEPSSPHSLSPGGEDARLSPELVEGAKPSG
jgi:hypothetical protein